MGTTYDVHFRLIGKRVVNFLLVSIEVYSLYLTAEALRAKIDRKSAIPLQCGQFDFARIVRPTNILLLCR